MNVNILERLSTCSAWALIVFASSAMAAQPSSAAAASVPATAVALPSGTVAMVNKVPIKQAQLDEAVRASGQADSAQLRQSIKQQLIVRELFRQNAEKLKLDSGDDVRNAMESAKVNAEIQAFLRSNLHPGAVSEEQVRARYSDIVASFGKFEYKSSIISLPDEATANLMLEKLHAGTPFDILATQYSRGSTKAAGGELPWVSFSLPPVEGKTQNLPLPLAQALSTLKVGSVAPHPIQIGDFYVILKLDQKRAAQIPSFDQMQGTILRRLQIETQQKATTDLAAALAKGASIQQ